MRKNKDGFTIVELIIVIIVIAILATITVVAYNSTSNRAKASHRDAELSLLVKAIRAARVNTGKQTLQITNANPAMTSYDCATNWNNTANTEPKNLSKSGPCWTKWYTTIDNLGAASGMNLNGLKDGDANGNPYFLNENDGEGFGHYCNPDDVGYFIAGGGMHVITQTIPSDRGDYCATL